jgi:outer membrane receptor for ferrienterochelin and colicins
LKKNQVLNLYQLYLCAVKAIIAACLVIASPYIHAQNTFKAIVSDSTTREKLAGVVVAVMQTTNGAISDSAGNILISNIPNGLQTFQVSYIGYEKKNIVLSFPLSSSQVYNIFLSQEQQAIDDVVITTSRMNSRIDDAPIKVEVLGADDLNEESNLKPGNISSILGDVSGVQIQQTSAVSGNSVVRMQGLDGRYTLLLRDGLPAYGALSGGLSILQIPPLDLKQIEIVKGPSSTMNGGGAIAGLINFVSKEPADSNEAAFVLNQSSLLETNLDAYTSGRNGKIGYTLFAGGTHQFALDVNKDAYSDVPQTLSLLLHPQMFFYPDSKTRLRLGVVVNYENRLGGDMDVIHGIIDSAHQYFEKDVIQNYGADLILNRQMPKNQELSFKGSVNYLNRQFNTNYSELAGGQWNAYSEFYYGIKSGRDNFIVGANYLLEKFNRAPGDTSQFVNYTYNTIGIFAQYNYTIENRLNLQLGLRGDWLDVYGFFVLPSAAILVNATKELSFRVNAGSGYKNPDLLEIAGLNEDITSVVSSAKLLNEYSYGGTAEWNYRKLFGSSGVSLFINQTFFYTWVEHAVIENYGSNGVDSVYNLNHGATSLGVDNYIRISKDPIEAYLGYTFTYPRKNGENQDPYLPLTPLHRAAAVITGNIGKHFKLGLEGSLIGRQYLDDGSKTQPYFLLAASIQYHIKRITLVLNGENLLDARQTRFEPVVSGPPAHPTFSQIWAPVDGRVINLSVMVRI